jgi:predicted small secreted protein
MPQNEKPLGDKVAQWLRRFFVLVLMVGHRYNLNKSEEKLKKTTPLLWAAILVVLALEGCATIRGMGQDIQSLGRAITRSVSG